MIYSPRGEKTQKTLDTAKTKRKIALIRAEANGSSAKPDKGENVSINYKFSRLKIVVGILKILLAIHASTV